MDERLQFCGVLLFSPAFHFRSIWKITPLLLLLSCCVAARNSHEELPSPQSVYIDNSSLIWTPAPASQHNGVTNYTVESRSFHTKDWKEVASCARKTVTSCDVTSTQEQDKAQYGCVELRVIAQAHNLTSQPAEACSRLGDSCSPSVHVSAAGPGNLSVQLNSSHTLMREREHVAYRVYYGLEGQPVQEYENETSNSSLTIGGLDEGQTYCAYVQILLDEKKFGPPSCLQCVVLSESGDSCSPSEHLSTGPGFLSVQLNSSHTLRNAAYKVYYGLQGQPVQVTEEYKSTSSVTISGLAEGLTYCAYVQCFLHNRKLGPPSCPNCVVIPTSGGIQLVEIIGPVLLGVGLVMVVVGSLGCIVFYVQKSRKSKKLVVHSSNSGNENEQNTDIELSLLSKKTDLTPKEESKETELTPKEDLGLMSKETELTQEDELGLMSKETSITPKEELV